MAGDKTVIYAESTQIIPSTTETPVSLVNTIWTDTDTLLTVNTQSTPIIATTEQTIPSGAISKKPVSQGHSPVKAFQRIYENYSDQFKYSELKKLYKTSQRDTQYWYVSQIL